MIEGALPREKSTPNPLEGAFVRPLEHNARINMRHPLTAALPCRSLLRAVR
jgi:hypothetical protein